MAIAERMRLLSSGTVLIFTCAHALSPPQCPSAQGAVRDGQPSYDHVVALQLLSETHYEGIALLWIAGNVHLGVPGKRICHRTLVDQCRRPTALPLEFTIQQVAANTPLASATHDPQQAIQVGRRRLGVPQVHHGQRDCSGRTTMTHTTTAATLGAEHTETRNTALPITDPAPAPTILPRLLVPRV